MRSVSESCPRNRRAIRYCHRAHEADSGVKAMGEWKVPVSIRVREALRAEMEEFAAREYRKLGNLGELILEWGFTQLKAAGSTSRLLKVSLTPRAGKQPK
jgi:hypothetical protein